MELGAFLSALFSIVIIDLFLAGDNAIVIGLAARNLDAKQQKQAIIWGTLGAVLIRIIATFAVVWLLKIPGLMLVGGLLLIWIAYNLLTEEKNHGDIREGTNIFEAVKTIIIADVAMGIDNVLGIAGAAHGSFFLVVLGLLISVPVVVWGSSLFIKLIDRYPVIIYIGAGVLAVTAAKMIMEEKFLHDIFAAGALIRWGFIVLITVGVLFLGARKRQKI